MNEWCKLPRGFKLVEKGKCLKGDVLRQIAPEKKPRYEPAMLAVGCKINAGTCPCGYATYKVFRRPLKKRNAPPAGAV
jgi:hypothetical protein